MHGTLKTATSYPIYLQVGSIVIGTLISGIAVFLIVILTTLAAVGVSQLIAGGFLFTLAYDGLINSIFTLAIAFIWFWQTWRWRQSLLVGVGVGLFLWLVTLLKNQFYTLPYLSPPFFGIHGGIENAMLYISLVAFPYVLAKRIANPWAGIFAGTLGSAGAFIAFAIVAQSYTLLFLLPLILLALIFGFTFPWWRPLICYPFEAAWNLLLYHADEKSSHSSNRFLHWHAAFWDEYQRLPLFGLENHLVMVAERNAMAGKAVLEELSNSFQSWAAQEAQIELDARRLQNCKEINAISHAHRHLALAISESNTSVESYLRSFSRISGNIEAALAQESTYNQRLALKAEEERLDGLLRELTRSAETYAKRFRPIAASWRQIVAEHVQQLSDAVESRQEISNPYIIGIPLTEHQEIFVGRSDISERIERLLLDYRCPPLLLYGQRRTGKTSLLNNLGKLLPWHLIPLFVDLQGPTSLAKDYAGFLYNLGRAIITSAKRHRALQLPQLTREKLHLDPFTNFDEWLDEVEHHLENNQTMLLALDEFSALEHVFNKGLLDEASVLGMFRHIIQHRPRIKILLSGSNTIDEFERWASYLINVQTVHISYLQTNEARRLIEQPVKDYTLRYEAKACERVIQITRCHPALIQLLCAEIVTMKNKQTIGERRLATINDVEAAIPGALQHGRFFFADIANNQVSRNGALILRYLATLGEGALVNLPDIINHCQLTTSACEQAVADLIQREVLEWLDNHYRFQVELIRRWFIC
jgi:hypothetical protein